VRTRAVVSIYNRVYRFYLLRLQYGVYYKYMGKIKKLKKEYCSSCIVGNVCGLIKLMTAWNYSDSIVVRQDGSYRCKKYVAIKTVNEDEQEVIDL